MFSILTYVTSRVAHSEPGLPTIAMFPVLDCGGLFKDYDLHEVMHLSPAIPGG